MATTIHCMITTTFCTMQFPLNISSGPLILHEDTDLHEFVADSSMTYTWLNSISQAVVVKGK